MFGIGSTQFKNRFDYRLEKLTTATRQKVTTTKLIGSPKIRMDGGEY